jgi:tRNA1Val (adenine37-N6)-methyltransferase
LNTNDLTSDTFFNGRLTVWQSLNGYRFSIDAVILAGLTTPKPGDGIVDLGSGCGIIPLMLAFRHPDVTITAVEIQPDLAELSRRNIRDNGLTDRIRLQSGDMTSLTVSGLSRPADLVVSNPPYHKQSSGRINPETQKAIARHEISVTLEEVVETAKRLLRTAGRLVIIYPAERLSDLMNTMRAHDIEPKWLRTVHTHRETEAKLVVVEGTRRGNPGLKIDRPFFIYRQDGRYSEEMETLFEP